MVLLAIITRAMITLATWVTAPVADTESFERKARLLYDDMMIIIYEDVMIIMEGYDNLMMIATVSFKRRARLSLLIIIMIIR